VAFRPQALMTRLEQVQRERFLAREVFVERRIRVPAFPGDVTNAGAVQAASGKQTRLAYANHADQAPGRRSDSPAPGA
jgi:hypothetical protein